MIDDLCDALSAHLFHNDDRDVRALRECAFSLRKLHRRHPRIGAERVLFSLTEAAKALGVPMPERRSARADL